MKKKMLVLSMASFALVSSLLIGANAISSNADSPAVSNVFTNSNEETSTSIKCNHQYVTDKVVKEATCTKKGKIETYCNNCNKLMKKVITPAKGHTYENYACVDCGSKDKPKLWKLYNTTDATYKVTLALSNGMGNVTYVAPLDKNATVVEIPADVNINGITYQVTKIADEAFKDCTKLKKVKVGKEVKTIGKYAFKNCKNLSKVTLTSGLEEIEKGAFEDCNDLNSITIPKNVKKIGKEAFKDCDDLKKAKIGKNVKTIDNQAFYDCDDLKKVEIGKNVKTIGKEAFKNCEDLKEIAFTGDALKKIEKNAFEGIDSGCVFLIEDEYFETLKVLFTSETGFVDTMTLKMEYSLLDIILNWSMGSDDAEESESGSDNDDLEDTISATEEQNQCVTASTTNSETDLHQQDVAAVSQESSNVQPDTDTTTATSTAQNDIAISNDVSTTNNYSVY